jgi:hypothetical protein
MALMVWCVRARTLRLLIGDGYRHGQVKHGEKDWAHYDYPLGETVSTNGVENFWRQFKNSVRSTHISISPKHMPRYLAEFTFRANHRDHGNVMLDLILRAMSSSSLGLRQAQPRWPGLCHRPQPVRRTRLTARIRWRF